MNLLVNAVGIKHSGGAVVLLDFVQEALRHEKIDNVFVLCSPRVVRNFDLPHSDNCIELEQAAAERSYLVSYSLVATFFATNHDESTGRCL